MPLLRFAPKLTGRREDTPRLASSKGDVREPTKDECARPPAAAEGASVRSVGSEVASKERRAHPRAKGLFNAAWSGAAGNRDLRVTDFSEGGCFVQSVVNLPVGDRFWLKLELPQVGEILVVGEVVSSDPGMGFAVRFRGLTGAQQKAIRDAVRQVAILDRLAERDPLGFGTGGLTEVPTAKIVINS